MRWTRAVMYDRPCVVYAASQRNVVLYLGDGNSLFVDVTTGEVRPRLIRYLPWFDDEVWLRIEIPSA